MFGRKTALIKHYEGEIDRLRKQVEQLMLRNGELVDRLLAKNGVPPAVPEHLPADIGGIERMAIFEDIEDARDEKPEPVDNRRGEKYDAFAG